MYDEAEPSETRAAERRESERTRVEQGMDARLSRAVELPRVTMLPLSYLAPASLELRHQFIDGNWYGCILLAVALADGYTKHVATSYDLDPLQGTDAIRRAGYLRNRGKLSSAAFAACERVWGGAADRNRFMHFNADMETDNARLEARARGAVFGIHALHEELFGYDVVQGRVRQRHPELWPAGDKPGTTSVYIDFM